MLFQILHTDGAFSLCTLVGRRFDEMGMGWSTSRDPKPKRQNVEIWCSVGAWVCEDGPDGERCSHPSQTSRKRTTLAQA